MASNREDGPVYYREIQKNAYLKRIPNEVTGSKLRPLSKQKVPLKAMWTQFCIHNGRTPYLEQYPDADSPATLCHAPIWRACLKTARHVTASVKPHIGEQYDFLVDTDNGAVRMLAPDWESMQDWVTTLRNALHELKITGKGENVYCSAPAPPPAPRAPARDPTSPLPPTPAVPVDRVPGIELTPVRTQNQPETTRANDTTRQTEPTVRQQEPSSRNNDPSVRPQETSSRNNDPTVRQQDPTSRLRETTNRNTETTSRLTETSNRTTDPTGRLLEPTVRPQETSSRLLETAIRNADSTVSNQDTIENGIENIDISNWDEPFSSLPSTSQFKSDKNCSVTKICGQNICLDDSLFKRPNVDSDDEFFTELDKIDDDAEYKQTVVVSSDEKIDSAGSSNTHPVTNVTVIQVSNKEPPHTAIPVMGNEIDVFDFEFKQNFINIVNTEENQYGTTFGNDSEYGHISLTTTVNLSGESNRPTPESNRPNPKTNRTASTEIPNSNHIKPNSEDLYERLCLASTSKPSPLPVKKLQNTEKSRKSSLPNLEIGDSTYEYLFLGNNNNTSSVTTNNTTDLRNNTVEVRNNTAEVRNNTPEIRNNTTEVRSNTRNVLNNTPNTINITNTTDIRNNTTGVRNNTIESRNNTTEGRNNTSEGRNNTSEGRNNTTEGRNNTIEGRNNTTEGRNNTEVNCNSQITRSNTVQVNTRPNDPISRLRAVERSRSQNEYDVSSRRTQNNSSKIEIKNETTEQPQSKPIWKRGLTELSILSLSRLRSNRQNKKRDSPTRNGTDNDRSPNITSPKVLHRSRNENRIDSTRRRSSSLSNGQSPPLPALTPLRAQQAATLIAEQRRGAALVATIPVRDPPVFADYDNQVWVSSWGGSGARVSGRVGDRLAALRRRAPASAGHARALLQGGRTVDILFHRVPLGKIYVISKRDQEHLGIKLDSECNIISVESGSPAARAGLPLSGAWAVTEVNNRPINLVKGGEEDMHRLSRHGTEVSLLLHPSPLVKQLRNSLKGNKSLLGLR